MQKLIKNICLTVLGLTIFATPVFTQKFNNKLNDGTVLAESNGYTLTENHIQIGVTLLNFLSGTIIKQSEVVELRSDIIRLFRQNPQAEIAEIENVEKTMRNAYNLSDPLKIAEVRILVLGNLHKNSQGISANQLPAFMKIMNRYVKVLAYDDATRLILTDKDLNATIAFVDFQRKLAGLAPAPTAQKTTFRQTITQNFSQIPNDQKGFFAAMSILWEVVQANWSSLSPQQQQQVIAQNKAKYIQPTPQTSRSYGNIRVKDQLLNEIVLNGNLARTNMIGSMGNSNYWEVSRSRSSTSPLNW